MGQLCARRTQENFIPGFLLYLAELYSVLMLAPSEANHHRLIADLLFANSKQWEQFQLSRRGNPGLIRGTFRFLRIAFFQTYRGLVYLGRALKARRQGAAPQLAERHP